VLSLVATAFLERQGEDEPGDGDNGTCDPEHIADEAERACAFDVAAEVLGTCDALGASVDVVLVLDEADNGEDEPGGEGGGSNSQDARAEGLHALLGLVRLLGSGFFVRLAQFGRRLLLLLARLVVVLG